MITSFENFAIGTKVQSFDKDGYFIMNACGIIVKYLGNGQAIIKAFNGKHYSTIGERQIFEIEVLN